MSNPDTFPRFDNVPEADLLNLLDWAKHACEETRAFYGHDDGDFPPPSWLAELEDAVQRIEHHQKD